MENVTQFSLRVVKIGLPKSYNRKVCATSVEFIKQGLVVLLSTFSPSKTNGHPVSVTQTKRVLISNYTEQSL